MQPLLDGVIEYLPNPSEIQNFAIDNSSNIHASIKSKKLILTFFLLETTFGEEGEPVFHKINLKPDRFSADPFVGLAFKLEQGS